MTAWERIMTNFVMAAEAKPKKATAIPDGYKQCGDCKKLHLLANFYTRRGHGYASRCKPCYKAYQLELQRKRRARKTPSNS
jgi:hypothetical protein